MINRLSLSLLIMASAFAASMPLQALHAQVSTNFGALPSRSPQTVKPHTNRPQSALAPQRPAPPQTPVPSGYTQSLDVPPKAPTAVVIAPAFTPVPVHPPVLPDEIKPVPTAQSQTSASADQGLRILFSPSSNDMNAGTIDAVRQFGAQIATHPEQRLILHSFANLPGDELSMPRRIALARALAVRSILIRSGVASTRIYPIAQGRPDVTDHAPADRLDIAVEANPEDGPPSTPIAARDTFSADTQGAPTP